MEKYAIVAVYFTTLRVLLRTETLVGHVMCLKGLIAAAFESSEPLRLLRLNGCIGAIPICISGMHAARCASSNGGYYAKSKDNGDAIGSHGRERLVCYNIE